MLVIVWAVHLYGKITIVSYFMGCASVLVVHLYLKILVYLWVVYLVIRTRL